MSGLRVPPGHYESVRVCLSIFVLYTFNNLTIPLIYIYIYHRLLACCDVYPNVNRIIRVQCPVFVLHGQADREVGVEHGVECTRSTYSGSVA